jgi:hypothetical protein
MTKSQVEMMANLFNDALGEDMISNQLQADAT